MHGTVQLTSLFYFIIMWNIMIIVHIHVLAVGTENDYVFCNKKHAFMWTEVPQIH